MSRYPIEPPTRNWTLEAITVFTVCCYNISSVNPGAWRGFDDSDITNGLGLMMYTPGSFILDYIAEAYPTLEYTDGLAQVKFFESGYCPWAVGDEFIHQTFADFTVNCTDNYLTEVSNLLVQIGYCDRTLADYYATQWETACRTQYMQFLTMSDTVGVRNKWINRNGQLTESEITNNIEILFSYSQGYVYKNNIWLYFKHYGWRM